MRSGPNLRHRSGGRAAAVRALVVAGGLTLAAIQLCADAALGDGAAARTLPGLLSARFGDAVRDAPAGLLQPALRTALARRELAKGDLLRAGRLIATLPPSPARESLRGRLRLRCGDEAGAIAAFTAAGDAEDLAPLVERIGRRDPSAALAIAGGLAARLARDPARAADAAETAWRIAALYGERARRATPAAARADRLAARAAIGRAIALAPYDEKYLLGGIDAALALGDVRDARALGARLARLDPTSRELPSVRARAGS